MQLYSSQKARKFSSVHSINIQESEYRIGTHFWKYVILTDKDANIPKN